MILTDWRGRKACRRALSNEIAIKVKGPDLGPLFESQEDDEIAKTLLASRVTSFSTAPFSGRESQSDAIVQDKIEMSQCERDRAEESHHESPLDVVMNNCQVKNSSGQH